MAAQPGEGPTDVLEGGSRSPREANPLWTALGVGAVVVALVAVFLHGRDSPGPPDAEPSPPGRDDTRPSLPLLATYLPEHLDLTTRPELRLSGSPVGFAIALLQPVLFDPPDSSVVVLGDDGRLRLLNVGRLEPARDRDGNLQPALDPTSLSPDGRRAAFAQPDRIVLVDLTTATATDLPLPGWNESVSWLGDELVATQEGLSFLLEPETGAVSPYPASASDLAFDASADCPAVEVTAPAGPGTGIRVRQWCDPATPTERPIPTTGDIISWSGPGWARDGHVARVAVLDRGESNPAGPPVNELLLIDVETATIARGVTPPLDTDTRVNYHVVLGWLNDTTVLISSASNGQQIIGWNVDDGSFALATRISGPSCVIALAANVG